MCVVSSSKLVVPLSFYSFFEVRGIITLAVPHGGYVWWLRTVVTYGIYVRNSATCMHNSAGGCTYSVPSHAISTQPTVARIQPRHMHAQLSQLLHVFRPATCIFNSASGCTYSVPSHAFSTQPTVAQIQPAAAILSYKSQVLPTEAG